MTALHSLALGVGYVTLFLIAAWGLFIAVVGAINILKPVVEARPNGTRLSVVASGPRNGPLLPPRPEARSVFPIGDAKW